jgi:anti-anti-sigma factor
MIRASMDTAEIERSEGGTTVLMDRQLRRFPVLAAGEEHPLGPRDRRPAHSAEWAFSARTERSTQPKVVVRGPVDMSTVEEFRRFVQDAGRGGSLPLVLDLTDVNHLASAGVQALHELAEQMAADGRRLGVIAPPSCPARQVLELTGLGRLVVDVQPTGAPSHGIVDSGVR